MKKISTIGLVLSLALLLGVYTNVRAEEILYVGERCTITKTPVDCTYKIISVTDGLLLVRNNDYKVGLVDKSGTVILPVEYEAIENFNEGVAAVRKDGKYGFIDKSGQIIIPLEYDYAYKFSEGVAAVKKDEKYGFIDKNNVTVIPFDYDGAQSFSEGLAAVSKKYADPFTGTSFGFIDKTGTLVIPYKYNSVFNFSEGLAAVKLNWSYGFIDKTGEFIIPAEYQYTREFREGYAAVWDGKDLGYIDKTGKLVIPYESEKYDRTGMEDAYFSDGLARVYCAGKFGFIDKTGTIVIPIEYDSAVPFENGVAWVYKDGKDHYIDETGTIIVSLDSEHFQKYITEVINTTQTQPNISQPNPPQTATAKPIAATVLVNGVKIEFDAYEINGNNYFKLRDLATVVNGTDKQFEVTYDDTKDAISLISGKRYTSCGGELSEGDAIEKPAALSTSAIYKDDVLIKLTAYTINDNNYFKLRDIAKAFDIGVTWDGETSTIGINTSISYTE